MVIYSVIPARGGSKRVPKKNIKNMCGKPLIFYTIEQSLSCNLIHKTFVSTDSDEIIEIVKENYPKVNIIKRPPEISGDLSTDQELFQHFLTLENPDVIIHLRPTFPLRSLELLTNTITSFINNYDYDSLRTVVFSEKPAIKMYTIENEELIPLFRTINNLKDPFNMPAQKLPKTYWHNGCIDIFKSETLRKYDSISGEKIYAYIMDKSEVYDIDTEEDFIFVENVMRSKMKI